MRERSKYISSSGYAVSVVKEMMNWKRFSRGYPADTNKQREREREIKKYRN
jgi:hypothetical protein